mmetsp:Transcript_87412/g.164777  ORF Transcript_87412/g.164777 Transcript_87412/m.164777 type:complete len:228 (-) Transcript_87412:458-1141(-)
MPRACLPFAICRREGLPVAAGSKMPLPGSQRKRPRKNQRTFCLDELGTSSNTSWSLTLSKERQKRLTCPDGRSLPDTQCASPSVFFSCRHVCTLRQGCARGQTDLPHTIDPMSNDRASWPSLENPSACHLHQPESAHIEWTPHILSNRRKDRTRRSLTASHRDHPCSVSVEAGQSLSRICNPKFAPYPSDHLARAPHHHPPAPADWAQWVDYHASRKRWPAGSNHNN